MTLTRWLFLSIFALAVIAAWQIAQPERTASPPTAVKPGNPFNDAAVNGELVPQRLIINRPEPRKISDGALFQ
ncbi:MAG: hypothetical protein SGJ27_05710 [Candidatus Melainabacteria bacterium]|nr:hypothetical protein [Candidatus Melainabacteria bacterium]